MLRRVNARIIFIISIWSLFIVLSACTTTVRIGSQTWAAKNLDAVTFRNGDAIPEAKTDAEWINAAAAKQAAWCYYNNDPVNGNVSGKLYNWYAVNDSRGLAPKGWHIPADSEWGILVKSLGGENVAGGKLKSRTGWIAKSICATDSSRFNGKPAGLRDYDGTFNGLGSTCQWWSASVCDSTRAWDRLLLYSGCSVHSTMDAKAVGFAVRCLKGK